MLLSAIKYGYDVVVTLLLWSYYSIGFVLFFSPFYLAAFLFSKDRERAFQRLNHRFYRGFFFLLRSLVPWNKWRIQDEVLRIRSSIIVCNHISYLDSILMISLFEKQKTIVKARFFRMPIFRKVVELSGYIPASSSGETSETVVKRIEEMEAYLGSGGNLFVFPEGTRSRDGAVGTLNKGVFKIARFCRKPIKVLLIRNTDKLFKPGKFLFHTCVPNTISVQLLATLEPDYQSVDFSISELTSRVRTLLEGRSVPSETFGT
ncbi:MAG: 1-acyl-sn-glycerol-3-phosphate acyltransferase [Desulfobacteraceae bacterium]|nr:MAG: 1-acyl-sn-glycerol-3-phosphate acyltransferase [Desulfobacteraceae bacterium]